MTAALMGLAPVLVFLGGLVALDSYKLVRLRLVIATVVAGMVAAGAVYGVNAIIFPEAALDFTRYSRYVAPAIEELLKALVVVYLVRSNRVGFLVDAAILGFAVGAGFAVLENLHYMRQVPEAGMGTWLVRGFGTAIMHGGTTAIFAVVAAGAGEGARKIAPLSIAYVMAVVIHSAFNHFFFSPLVQAVGIAAVLPAILGAVFSRSEKEVSAWLGKGFDADSEMLELINSGRFADSPIGRYLRELRDKFEGAVVADLLCYLRLYTELALRAKGILMMRETGFEVPVDDATREKFAELRYLEKSIGRTGLIAIRPMLHMTYKELWQLYMLGK